MTEYRIDLGDYTITFDNLADAQKYADDYFKRKGIVVGIEEIV